MKFHTSILDKNQKDILPKLSFLSKDGFYLAGGTALALQIGHRTSVDFDFFVKKHFNS
ncbi:MAG: nucleotidyl transferase AbiEii/AbiGii toxin family protein [Patescibacteria group bacterium]